MSRPKNGFFQPEQAAAWSAFYVEEERSASSASTSSFAAMLLAHGAPDCGNPLPNDDEAHFLIHPGGFIAGEIDRCLRHADTELDALRGERALDRLGLLAHMDCPMTSARAYWADEDIRFAMAIAALEGRWELFGARAPQVVVHAMRRGLLEPQVAPGLLVARRMAEDARHLPPWKLGFWLRPKDSPSEPVEELPPAPELDLASWRKARPAALDPAMADISDIAPSAAPAEEP